MKFERTTEKDKLLPALTNRTSSRLIALKTSIKTQYLLLKTMKIEYTKKARQDERKAGKRGKDLQKFHRVLHYFQRNIPLPPQYRKHRLWQSKYQGAWEVHLEPNWLLVYQIVDNTVLLIRSGTHPDIFE